MHHHMVINMLCSLEVVKHVLRLHLASVWFLLDQFVNHSTHSRNQSASSLFCAAHPAATPVNFSRFGLVQLAPGSFQSNIYMIKSKMQELVSGQIPDCLKCFSGTSIDHILLASLTSQRWRKPHRGVFNAIFSTPFVQQTTCDMLTLALAHMCMDTHRIVE